MSERILSTPAPGADLRLPYGPDPLQFGDLRLPAGSGPHPVVVFVHGGFWRARYDLEHTGHACAALTAAGAATWNVEYRRIGNTGGGWPGTFLDVAAATDHLRAMAPEYDLDLARLVTLGHSAGGHLALWLAARARVTNAGPLHSATPLLPCAVVSLAGVVDLKRAWDLRLSDGVVRTFMGGRPDEVPDRYSAASPAALLPLGLPQVLIHGSDDDSVPFSLSRDYCAAANALGDRATLIPLRGAGHFEVVDPDSREWPAVLEAARSLLGLA